MIQPPPLRVRPWPHTARFTRKIRVSVAAGLLGLIVGACGEDDESARGDVVCNGLECQCPGTGDCQVDCRSDCDLSCTGSGDCDFACGAACAASCPGSGLCVIDVGADSSVDCPGSGGCDVTCHGDCSVDCPGSGTCTVRCDATFDCNITRCEDAISCPEGVRVCNGECPPV
jgi:hypothetical protein